MERMSWPDQTPPEVAAYGRLLATALASSSGQRLVGAYLHGSAALGGWLATRSDVDLLFVVEDAAAGEALVAVERVLVGNAPVCPGTGLECTVVSAQQAGWPEPPWPFLLHVQSSAGKQARVVRGKDLDGDPDLLMHYAACRAAGVAVYGPEPMDVFGVVPRAVILAYLADELVWGLAHASEAYAVLNSCRALVYAARRELVSKVSGGRMALELGLGPPEVIARALEEQEGLKPPAAVGADASAFVLLTAESLRPDPDQAR
jgi:hypothetical protein